MGLKSFWIGVVAGLFLAGCVAAKFPYRYYLLEAESFEGKLLSNKPENDLALSVCAPDENKTGKCTVMLTSEYLQLKAEYKDLVTRLDACEHGR